MLHPIIVDEDGNILDGRHRYKIDRNCKRKVMRGLSEAEKEALVFRSNNARRNLSPEQKAELRERMQETAFRLREEDKKYWTQKRVSVSLGVAQQTVSSWFISNTSNGKANNGKPSNGKPKKKPKGGKRGTRKSKPRVDARMTLSPEACEEIVDRLDAGDKQQQIAADFGVSQSRISQVAKKIRTKRQKEAEKKKQAAAAKKKAAKIQGIVHGDFRETGKQVADKSCALVFTDPPYDRAGLPLFDDLGEFANRVLVDGGSLITFCGQYVLNDVMESLSNHLRYFWINCCLHTGNTAQMREYGIKVKWKPMLWFVKGDFRRDRNVWVDDLVASVLMRLSNQASLATLLQLLSGSTFVLANTDPSDFPLRRR